MAQLGEAARCRQSWLHSDAESDVIALFQQVDVGTPVIVTANEDPELLSTIGFHRTDCIN